MLLDFCEVYFATFFTKNAKQFNILITVLFKLILHDSYVYYDYSNQLMYIAQQ